MKISRKTAYVICLGSIIFYSFQASSTSYLFEPSSYQPTLELSLKGSNQRTLGHAGVVMPLQGSDRNLWFTQLWGLWDSNAAKEWNVGLGYRHRLVDWIVGAYGFFDRRLSALNHYHSQLTFGVELLGEHLETRLNGYVPTTSAKRIGTHVADKVKRVSLVLANMLEKPLGGVDIEAGGTLTPGKTLQGFLTYYHFNGRGVKAIDGVRLRGQLQLIHYVALTGEACYDRLRKTSWFAGMQLNFRLGAPKKKLSEKMTQMIIRDIDVITDCYAQHKKREHKNPLSSYTIQKFPKPLVDKHPVSLEIKAFIAPAIVRDNMQSIVVYSPTNIWLKPRLLNPLNSLPSQLISVPCYDVQGIASCKHLKDVSYVMNHSYWRITSLGKGYGISVHARGLGGGANHSKDATTPASPMTCASPAGMAMNQSSHVTEQHTTVTQEIPKPFKPQALGVRPDRNPQFVPRQSATGADVLAELTRRFDNTSNLTIAVLTGMGGLGKTQLAVEYIEQTRNIYDGIFWVQANTSPVNYLSFIEALAIDLKATKPEVLVSAIHQRLIRSDYQKVLWIYDDVPDASVFHRALFHKELKGIWRQAGIPVHVLVTSRYQNWGRLMPIQIALFNKKNTTTYIASFFKEGLIPFPQPSSETIEQFNTLLGGLPLAIAQAVAYIHHKRDETGLQAYIEAYQANYKQAAWLEYSIETLDDYDKMVWTTWDITRKNLSEEADSLLQMSCFLAHEPIAKLLFSLLGEDKVLQELADYSLIKLSSDCQSFSLHVLLQKMLQLQQGQGCEALKRVCALAADAMNSFDERKAHSWASVKQWLPHLQALLEHVEDEVLSTRLFYSYGIVADFFGLYTLAKHYCTQALALQTRHYGKGHIQLADTSIGLGNVEYALGQYEEAKGYYNQALALQTRHYGEAHIQLAVTLNNLGNVEYDLGHYEAAKNYYSQALALQTHPYGEAHIELTDTLNNLGTVELSLGHYEEAKDYYSQALALKTRHYGEAHIQLADTLIGLGNVELSLGHYEEAKGYYSQALVLQKNHYDEKHLELADTLNNLGNVESDLGHYEAAKAYLEKALALKIYHYGVEHLELANTLGNLGNVEYKLGRYEAAKAYYAQTLALQKNHYREEQIQLADTLNNLGSIETDLGHYEVAKGYLEKALALKTRHYGKEHIELAATLHNLGAVEYDLEQYEAAKAYLEKVLVLQTRHYGKEHVQITVTLKNLEMIKSKINCKDI